MPAEPRNIMAIGGCMIYTLMGCALKSEQFLNTLYNKSLENVTCYSLDEITRTARHFMGLSRIPEPLLTYCGHKKEWENASSGDFFHDTELVLIEPNTTLAHLFDGIALDRTAVGEKIVDPIMAISKETFDRGSNWFNAGLIGNDNDIVQREGEFLARFVEGRFDDPELVRRILTSIRTVRREQTEFTEAIAKFVRLVDRPVAVVTFTNRYLPDGRGISWPADLVNLTVGAARELKLPLFHPADHVRQFGVRKAMQPDLRFYRDEFIDHIGPKFMEFCHRAASLAKAGPNGEAGQPGSGEDTAVVPEPTIDILREYDEAWRSGRSSVIISDFSRIATAWFPVRATLEDEARPTPVAGIFAKLLLEDETPDNFHDLRRYVATEKDCRYFRLSFVAKPEGRNHMRAWIASGKPGSASDRVDVCFDLSDGTVMDARSTIDDLWQVEEADARMLGGGWGLFRVSGSISRDIPELFLSLMTASTSGGTVSGERGKGIWIGGVMLEMLGPAPAGGVARPRPTE